MNKQLTGIPLSGSAWQILDKLDTTLNSKSPLAEKLQNATSALLDIINVDAIWCVAVSPLPSLACGIIRTPSSMAPQARITVTDNDPYLENNPAFANTPLNQVINGYNLDMASISRLQTQIDADLCDASFSAFHIAPVAIVPIVAKTHILGALVAGLHKNSGALSEEQHNLLVYLGKHIGQYLQNAFLVNRATHHANTLDTLNQISRTITSSLDIDDVIQKTMAGINTLLNVEAGSLLLQDPGTQELYFKVTLRGENKQVTSYRLQPNEGVAGWVVTNNQAAIVNQPATDTRFTNKIDRAIGFTTHNILCVPLVVRGKASGALELINKRSGPFTDDDQQLLISMAASLGVALNNALLYEDVRARAQQNEVFNQITTAINSGHGLSDTARLIFNQFGRLFAFDHISFSVIDTLNNKIKQWTFNETGSIEETGPSIPIEDSKLAQIITNNRGVIENNLGPGHTENLQYPDQVILQNYNISSIIAVPLATQTTPYGCLCLGSKQNKIYGIRQLNTLERFAPQIAVVLEKALLIDATEKRAAEMQQLNRLGEMLASTIDLKLIIDTTVTMLPRILSSSEIHGVVIAGEEGAFAGLAVPSGFWKKKPIVQEMFNTLLELQARSVPTELISIKTIVTDLSVSPDWKPETNLILPIITRQGTQGVIYTASAKSENFSDDFLRVFSLIVSQISAAVENALLFQQVEQERARLAAILASTTDAVLVVDRKGRIVLDNPAARKLINAKESQSGHLLTESTTLEPLIQLFENAFQGGKTTGEIPLKDNRTFFANLSPVSVGDAGTIGWVATMQDVSHFKELDDLKNEFVGTVSHDLRSPLSSILIATKLIEQAGETNADQQDLINMVERRIQGMSELIDDLLDVGHIEAGVDMNLESCNVALIVNDVTTELISQANDKEIQLNTTITENIPPMLANETRLQQVVHNLVGNAIKYTPNGGTVTVKAYPHKDEVRVQIIDTGLGIPASDQPHIFEKFYRVRGEHVLGIKGTGLGLAIVKSIVDKLNGRIWLESVFGEGSTFTVAFPVSKEVKPHNTP